MSPITLTVTTSYNLFLHCWCPNVFPFCSFSSGRALVVGFYTSSVSIVFLFSVTNEWRYLKGWSKHQNTWICQWAECGENNVRGRDWDTESDTWASDSSVSSGRVEVISNMQLAGKWLVRYPVKRHLAKNCFQKVTCDIQNGVFNCLLMTGLLPLFSWCLGAPWEPVAVTLLLALPSKGINFLEIDFRKNVPCKF